MNVADRTLANQPDGGEAILEAFRNLHIEYVISSPGSEWPPVWEAFARQKTSGASGPTYLDCGHETLAVGIAAGYTRLTGRMQAVLLHAGSGLLQGSMGIQGTRASEIPMLIMSGESLSYGELPDFDPGNQWYRNLGVVGGPQRLVDPLVKWANQAPSSETLYQCVVRAGEMAKRVPQGPVYLNVPCETMLQSWTPPKKARSTPEAPKLRPIAGDVAAVAAMIVSAKHPVILTETAGRDPGGICRPDRLGRFDGHSCDRGPGRSLRQFPEIASASSRFECRRSPEGCRRRSADRKPCALVSSEQFTRTGQRSSRSARTR